MCDFITGVNGNAESSDSFTLSVIAVIFFSTVRPWALMPCKETRKREEEG